MKGSYQDLLQEAAAEFEDQWASRLRRLSVCPTCGRGTGRLLSEHVCTPHKVVKCRIDDCVGVTIARRLCIKHYHQWYRRKITHAWLRERAKPSKPLCRCGRREQKAHNRCIPCYLAYRRANPKQCDCGRFYRSGTKCGACYKRDLIAKSEKCGCGLGLVLKGKGLCRTCQNLVDGVICTHCDRGLPVKTSSRCYKCLFEAYRSSEQGKRQHRRSEKKRRDRLDKEQRGIRVVRRR